MSPPHNRPPKEGVQMRADVKIPPRGGGSPPIESLVAKPGPRCFAGKAGIRHGGAGWDTAIDFPGLAEMDRLSLLDYNLPMPSIRTTAAFDDWFDNLRDIRARVRIQNRIDRLEMGNPGDSEPVGGGVVELRIDYGPGYRVYYVPRGAVLVVVLCGGDKSTQRADIARAKKIAGALDLE